MTDETPSPPLSPEEIAARLQILESLTLHIASSINILVAHHGSLTLDGVRTHLGHLHRFLLDDLLDTNSQSVIDAGSPLANQAIKAIFANVRQALADSEGKGTIPYPSADKSGPGPGEGMN